MKINDVTQADLALALSAERKRQKLSREDAAAVCGVSTSFIRDAESNPEKCSLGKLAQLINGLGLSLELAGLDLAPPAQTGPLGLIAAAALGGRRHADFGVPDSQLVGRAEEGLSDLFPPGPSQATTGLGLAALDAQHGIKGKSKGGPS